MKLIHTADWHLGKNIEGHSRLEEQRLFLKDFINILVNELTLITLTLVLIIIFIAVWMSDYIISKINKS